MLEFTHMRWHIPCDAAVHTSGLVSDVLRSADDEYSKTVCIKTPSKLSIAFVWGLSALTGRFAPWGFRGGGALSAPKTVRIYSGPHPAFHPRAAESLLRRKIIKSLKATTHVRLGEGPTACLHDMVRFISTFFLISFYLSSHHLKEQKLNVNNCPTRCNYTHFIIFL
jgi:hypothetical protein